MRKIMLIVFFVCLPVLAGAQEYRSVPEKTDRTKTSVVPTQRSQFAQEKIMRLRTASLKLRVLAVEPIPTHLNKRQMLEAQKHSRWLMDSSRKLDVLADHWESALLTIMKNNYTAQQMQEMNSSFNLQYSNLKQNMQQENRQFTLISNIMKVKNDTARSAINNVR